MSEVTQSAISGATGQAKDLLFLLCQQVYGLGMSEDGIDPDWVQLSIDAALAGITAAEARGHARSDAERDALVAEVAALLSTVTRLAAIIESVGEALKQQGFASSAATLERNTRAALAPVAELPGDGG